MDKYIKHIYFIFILIVSMEGSMYYRTKEMMTIRVVIAGILMFLYRIRPGRKLIYALSVWTIFVLFCYFITSDFQPTALLRYWMLFIESFLLIKLFGLKIFQVYIKTMLILAIISLVFFVLSNVSLSSVFNTMKVLDFSGGFREKTGDYIHAGFITLHNRTNTWTYGIPRNCGFAWEPGPFSILLNLAIYFNLAYKKESYKSYSTLLFIFALITTFSTTGLLIFLFSIIYRLLLKSNKPQYLFLLFLLLAGFFPLYNKYDFLGKKVQTYSTQEAFLASRSGKTYLSGSRLAGVPIVTQDIIRNPLFGKGLIQTGKYKYFGEMDSSFLNAIFSITSSMGLFGLFFFFYFIVKSSITISKIFREKDRYTLAIILIGGSFGFNIHVWSIVFTFITFSQFSVHNENIVKQRRAALIQSPG
jgi:hypothetical protein